MISLYFTLETSLWSNSFAFLGFSNHCISATLRKYQIEEMSSCLNWEFLFLFFIFFIFISISIYKRLQTSKERKPSTQSPESQTPTSPQTQNPQYNKVQNPSSYSMLESMSLAFPSPRGCSLSIIVYGAF